VISGTPTASMALANFTITATNTFGSIQVTIAISVASGCLGVCMPAAPTGWVGPLAIRTDSAPVSCTGAFPTQSGALAHAGLNAPAPNCANACTTSSSCQIICYLDFFTTTTTAGTCGGAQGGLSTNDNNSCIMMGPPYHAAGTDVRIGASNTSPYCRVDSNGAVPPAASWSTEFVACDGTNPTGACSAGNVCKSGIPAPFEPRFCIYKQGDPATLSCPAAYPAKRTFYQSYSDTRNCSECTCSSTNPSCTFDAVECTAPGCASCGTTSKIGCFAPMTFPRYYRTTVTPGGSCVSTSNSAPTGSAAGTNPVVVCCQPWIPENEPTFSLGRRL
jgi:hypothetical protein